MLVKTASKHLVHWHCNFLESHIQR